MTRRMPPPLRAWSGALLVCALMFCLSGLARPAMAMTMPASMGGSMGTAAATAVGGHASGQMPAEAAGQVTHVMASEAAEGGAHCPMAQAQCAAPKCTVAHDSPVGPALGDLPRAMGCSPAASVALPNAPPPALPPPDLHRLCVSRT